jgi:hypothetical protein
VDQRCLGDDDVHTLALDVDACLLDVIGGGPEQKGYGRGGVNAGCTGNRDEIGDERLR